MNQLHEDLSAYFKDWINNPCIPENEKKQRSRPPKMISLGTNHEDPIKLSNGETVGSVSKSSVNKYSSSSERRWPREDDLVRFGGYFVLEEVRDVCLIVKRAWEKYVAKKNVTIDLSHMMDWDVIKQNKNGFREYMETQWDADAVFNIFEKYKQYYSDTGYDKESFKTLVKEIISTNCYVYKNNGPEVDAFVKKQQEQRIQLRTAPDNQAEEFGRYKLMWIEARNTLETWLLELEDVRLNNAKIEQQWMATFGDVFLAMKEAEFKMLSLERRIELKRVHPDWSREELEAEEKQAVQEEQQKLKDIRERIAIGWVDTTKQGVHLKPEEAKNYLNNVKEVLGKIHMRTHPDRIAHERFTEEQRKKLLEYFERVTAIRPNELHPAQHQRTLITLLDILGAVEALWEQMGIDLEERTLIQGNTIEEQLRWLEKEITRLERETEEVRNEHFVMLNDAEVRKQSDCFEPEEKVNQVKDELASKCAELNAKAEEYALQLDGLFNQDAAK